MIGLREPTRGTIGRGEVTHIWWGSHQTLSQGGLVRFIITIQWVRGRTRRRKDEEEEEEGEEEEEEEACWREQAAGPLLLPRLSALH